MFADLVCCFSIEVWFSFIHGYYLRSDWLTDPRLYHLSRRGSTVIWLVEGKAGCTPCRIYQRYVLYLRPTTEFFSSPKIELVCTDTIKLQLKFDWHNLSLFLFLQKMIRAYWSKRWVETNGSLHGVTANLSISYFLHANLTSIICCCYLHRGLTWHLRVEIILHCLAP